MQKILTAVVAVIAGAALSVAPALAGGGQNNGGELPGCKPSHETPKKCHPVTTTTVTVTTGTTTTVTTGTTVTVPQTTTVVLTGPQGSTGPTGATGATGPQGPAGTGTSSTTPACMATQTAVNMPLNTKRWKGVNSGTVVVVGQFDGRQENNVTIHRSGKNTSVKVNVAGLPCGFYFVQLFNKQHNRRSVTRGWFVNATSVTRLIFSGPNPPLGEPPF